LQNFSTARSCGSFVEGAIVAAVNQDDGFLRFFEHGIGEADQSEIRSRHRGPLLLLHGGLFSIDMFGPNLAILSAHREPIAVNLQGSGGWRASGRHWWLRFRRR
jgi:pimeloyl-ACP methyl ester carboxylesterase